MDFQTLLPFLRDVTTTAVILFFMFQKVGRLEKRQEEILKETEELEKKISILPCQLRR